MNEQEARRRGRIVSALKAQQLFTNLGNAIAEECDRVMVHGDSTCVTIITPSGAITITLSEEGGAL